MADTARVRAAFFSDTRQGGDSKLFVIHSVEIRSDTGVKYSSDYFTVSIYTRNHDTYLKDNRLSRYFGNGADVLDDDYKNFRYVFPYKDQASIVERLASDSYSAWSAGSLITLVVDQKSPLYSSPVLADVTQMYVVAGDKVKQDDVEGGWLSITYSKSKGKIIRGWIQCANLKGC